MLNKSQATEFFTRLEGKEGCNFRLDNDDKYKLNCNRDYKLSVKILNAMSIPHDKQKEFLRVLRIYGGRCDCEIILQAKAVYMLHIKSNRI